MSRLSKIPAETAKAEERDLVREGGGLKGLSSNLWFYSKAWDGITHKR